MSGPARPAASRPPPAGVAVAVRALAVRRGGATVLDGVSLDAPAGRVLGLLGPNGSGKSTLLRCVAGLLRPDAGRVTLDGEDVRSLRRRAVARRLAVVAQEASTALDLSVGDVVALGRIPHRRGALGGGAPAAQDAAIVADALARVGLDGWEARRWRTLSGGERQRAQIARALAQEPRVLVLDEPTNHLDLRHRLELLALVRRLGLTVLVALHDLDLAATHCDRVAVLQGGRLAAKGTPAEALTAPLIRAVYGVDCDVAPAPDGSVAIRPRALGR